MKKYLFVNVTGGRVSPDILDKLNRWAFDKPDGRYVQVEPEEIKDPWTVNQQGAYWGRIDEMVEHIGDYTKSGYHFYFMWSCGLGEEVVTSQVNKETGEIEEISHFNPQSITKVGKKKLIRLIEQQEYYAFEKGYDLPSPEEWKDGKRMSKHN